MKLLNSTYLLAYSRMVLCICFFLVASAELDIAQTPTSGEPYAITSSVDAKPGFRLEASSGRTETAHDDNYIHFWNRSHGYVSLRISYKSKTGKKHSYTFANKGKRHGPSYKAVIDADNFFKIRICDGCTDFKIESWYMTNAFVFSALGVKPSWGHHKERTDVSYTSNSYWYVDRHQKLVKNNYVRSYTLYDVKAGYVHHDLNMWTGTLNGHPVLTAVDLPND